MNSREPGIRPGIMILALASCLATVAVTVTTTFGG